MREITDHKLNGINEALKVIAIDRPGPGGANHKYAIELHPEGGESPKHAVVLSFQNGPIGSPADMNGITGEALLAVLIDRLRGFQFTRDEAGNFTKAPGPFACRENAIALTKIEEALMWLQKRTRERMARGVEGTIQK